MRDRTMGLSAALAAVVITVAACGGEAGPLTVTEVWSRATASAQDTGVLYFEISGGPSDDSLIGVSVPTEIAAGAALHETVAVDTTATTMAGHELGGTTMAGHEMGGTTMAGHDMGDVGGGLTMRTVGSVAVAAEATVVFEPGGYHVMMLGLVEPLVAGQTFEVTLTFAEAGEVVVVAEVRE
jgi:periplasmic copper chaperone A